MKLSLTLSILFVSNIAFAILPGANYTSEYFRSQAVKTCGEGFSSFSAEELDDIIKNMVCESNEDPLDFCQCVYNKTKVEGQENDDFFVQILPQKVDDILHKQASLKRIRLGQDDELILDLIRSLTKFRKSSGNNTCINEHTPDKINPAFSSLYNKINKINLSKINLSKIFNYEHDLTSSHLDNNDKNTILMSFFETSRPIMVGALPLVSAIDTNKSAEKNAEKLCNILEESIFLKSNDVTKPNPELWIDEPIRNTNDIFNFDQEEFLKSAGANIYFDENQKLKIQQFYCTRYYSDAVFKELPNDSSEVKASKQEKRINKDILSRVSYYLYSLNETTEKLKDELRNISNDYQTNQDTCRICKLEPNERMCEKVCSPENIKADEKNLIKAKEALELHQNTHKDYFLKQIKSLMEMGLIDEKMYEYAKNISPAQYYDYITNIENEFARENGIEYIKNLFEKNVIDEIRSNIAQAVESTLDEGERNIATAQVAVASGMSSSDLVELSFADEREANEILARNNISTKDIEDRIERNRAELILRATNENLTNPEKAQEEIEVVKDSPDTLKNQGQVTETNDLATAKRENIISEAPSPIANQNQAFNPIINELNKTKEFINYSEAKSFQKDYIADLQEYKSILENRSAEELRQAIAAIKAKEKLLDEKLKDIEDNESQEEEDDDLQIEEVESEEVLDKEKKTSKNTQSTSRIDNKTNSSVVSNTPKAVRSYNNAPQANIVTPPSTTAGASVQTGFYNSDAIQRGPQKFYNPEADTVEYQAVALSVLEGKGFIGLEDISKLQASDSSQSIADDLGLKNEDDVLVFENGIYVVYQPKEIDGKITYVKAKELNNEDIQKIKDQVVEASKEETSDILRFIKGDIKIRLVELNDALKESLKQN